MELKCAIHNEFQFVLRDARTGKVKQQLKSYNVVTDYYFNRLRNSTDQLNYLYVGTGTGTPKVTDRYMFQMLTYKSFTSQGVVYLNQPGQEYLNAYRRVVLFNENEANGDITEVGLSSSYSDGYLWTHSVIVDSEGHPVSVHKTGTDTLEITSIVYSKIISSGFLQPVRQCGHIRDNGGFMRTGNPPFIESRCFYTAGVLQTLGAVGGFNRGGRLQFFLTREPFALDVASDSMMTSTGSRSITQDNKVRYTFPRLLASDLVGTRTYQIMSVALSFTSSSGTDQSFAYFNFPNHELYPPEKITFEKVGDGTTTDFNLGIPRLMEDANHIAVKIDGVLQDPSTYDWYGRDYNCWQAWPTIDTQCLKECTLPTGSTYGTWFTTIPFYRYSAGLLTSIASGSKSDPTGKWYICYDFQNPITVSGLCWKTGSNPLIDSNYRGLLQYSDDAETWSTAIEYKEGIGLITFTPVTARYWRVTNENGYYWAKGITPRGIGSGYDDDVSNSIYAFGDPKPQLRFHTAPAEGAVIKIEAYTEYPIKNDKWMLDQVVIDMDFVRGSE